MHSQQQEQETKIELCKEDDDEEMVKRRIITMQF
jgi:hypothetical protein